MCRIEALGLQKQPRDRPYRMSRAGRRLFHYIETIVSKTKIKTTEEIIIGVNKSNLTVVKKEGLKYQFFSPLLM